MPIVPYVPKANIDAAQFGVRAGSGIDNADALERLQTYLRASSIRHTVTFPAGLVQSSYNAWLSNLGAKGPRILAYDTQFQSTSDSVFSAYRYPLQIWPWHYVDVRRATLEDSGGSTALGTGNQLYGYKINTANAGAQTVTVQTAGDADNFAVGDLVCVHGLDQQGDGTPRNLKYFDYAVVESIDGADITLKEPLTHTYHQSWPDVSYQSPAMASGAPRIAPTSHANNDTTRRVEIFGAEFLGWDGSPSDHQQVVPYTLEYCKLVDCKMGDLYLSAGKLAELERCQVGTLEIDKLIEKVVSRETVYGGNDSTLPIGGGTGLRELEIHGGKIMGAVSSLTAQHILLNGVQGGPDAEDSAYLQFGTNYGINSLRVENCRFHDSATMAREFVGHATTPVKSYTTTATSANHGAGQFAISGTNYNALTGLVIGCPVWAEGGGAKGRVTAITYDSGSSEYLIAVDSSDAWSASTTFYVMPINNLSCTNNSTNSLRVGLVGSPQRDVTEESFVLRMSSKDIDRTQLNFGNRFPVGGTITKIRCTVSKATSTGGKDLRIYLGANDGADYDDARIHFALDVEGTREYSAASNTLHADDSVAVGEPLGFFTSCRLLTGLSTVDDDDLPKFEFEIHCNQPTDTLVAGQIADVRKFGAKANGGDDTPAIQAAIDAAEAVGGGVVYFPAGTYRLGENPDANGSEVSGTIPKGCLWVKSNVVFRGDGIGQTILKPTDDCPTDCPVFHLPATNATRGTTAPSNVGFESLEIDGNKSRAGDPASEPGDWGEGEGIDGKAGASGISIRNVYIHDTIQDAIDLDGCVDVTIQDFRAKDCGGCGIHAQADGATVLDGVMISNVIVESCGQECHTAGLTIRAGIGLGGNDVSLSNFKILDCVRGLLLGPAASVGRRQVTNGSIYNSDLQNIQIVASNLDNCLSNIHTQTSGGNGVEVLGSRAEFSNCSFRDATGYGVYVTTRDVSFSGCRIYSGSNETDSLCCDYTTISGDCGFQFIGGQIHKPSSGDAIDVDNSGSVSQGFAVIGTGFPSGGAIRLGGMDEPIFIGTTGSAAFNFESSTGHIIAHNRGYVLDNHGSGTIADASSTVNISHGCNRTPTSVVVTPAGDERVWVTSVGASTFTVNRSGSSGTLNFYWRAQY